MRCRRHCGKMIQLAEELHGQGYEVTLDGFVVRYHVFCCEVYLTVVFLFIMTVV